MRRSLSFLAVGVFAGVTAALELRVTETPQDGAFTLVGESGVAEILVDPDEAAVVREVAAAAFAEDVRRVAGELPRLRTSERWIGRPAVIIGTLGESDLIAQLSEAGEIAVDDLDGLWESFRIVTLSAGDDEPAGALVVVGSDRRGTAYGVFELSRAIGVPPWHWWADAPVRERTGLHIAASGERVGPPSVKYRGVFLNDEDWGLQPWAAESFEPETGDIGPKTYAAVFELLLRLRANHIWPAMHPSTRAFNFYPENKLVADRYAIVMGSSHAEPMLRNNVDEWRRDGSGEWNFLTNRENVLRYWDRRVAENARFENIYTIGMRGIHDSAMVGARSMDERVRTMEEIFAEQRAIIKRHTGRPAGEVPQAFVPYKEVLPIYRAGLDVPEDVTLVWPEDNHGYIRRLSDADERARSGGSGVYTHISYWGMPHDYLWLNSTPPGLIWEEMTKAHEFGADRIWVLNVGDIKPGEIGMDYFLRLAWDIDAYGPRDARRYLVEFFAETIGPEHAGAIAGVMDEYFLLNHVRKPEHMGWGRVYPSETAPFTEFSHWAHGDEARRRLDAFEDLVRRAEAIGDRLDPTCRDAYLQLVLYPVRGAANMNRKVLYAEKSRDAALLGLPVANRYAEMARAAHEQIQRDTEMYNTEIAGGKWRRMMVADPRGLAVFDPPSVAEVSAGGEPALVARVEGSVVPAVPAGGETRAEPSRPAVITLRATEGLIAEPLVRVPTPDGEAVTFPQHGSVERLQGDDGPARVGFDLPVSVAGRYVLEIEANHPDPDSDSWHVCLDDRPPTVFNDLQTGGAFDWLRVTELTLSPGVHRLTFVAREDGAQLRRLRLSPAGRPAVFSHPALTRSPNRLPTLDRFTARDVFIDLYNTGTGTVGWTAEASDDWIELSGGEGRVGRHQRLHVSVDFARAPRRGLFDATITVTGGGRVYEFTLPVRNPPTGVARGAWVQENGWISIDAEAFRDQSPPANGAVRWGVIDGVGYTGSVVGLFPRLIDAPMPLTPGETSPALTYPLHVFEGGEATVTFRALPTHEIHDGHTLSLAFAVDGGEPRTVVFDQGNDEHNPVWQRNVRRGVMTGSAATTLTAGPRTLTVYGLDPSVVLDQIVIGFGDPAPAYLGPRPTRAID